MVPVLNDWIAAAEADDLPIYASRDFHPQGHMSFSESGGPWPLHCIQDTDGARFHPDLDLPDSAVVVTKGVRLDQDQNSAFDQTGLATDLKKQHVQRVFVGGLAEDVCVLATALDGRKEGFKVVLIQDATRPVTPEGGVIRPPTDARRRSPTQRLERPGDISWRASEVGKHLRRRLVIHRMNNAPAQSPPADAARTPALSHSRMRHRQVRQVDHQGPVKKDVDVEHSRPIQNRSAHPYTALDFSYLAEQFEHAQPRPHPAHRVNKRRLKSHSDGRGLVQARYSKAGRKFTKSLYRPLKCSRACPQDLIRAPGKP